MSTDTQGLTAAMQASLAEMKAIMEASISYQTRITEVTTYLGQVAARAAKQTPQG